MRLPRIAGAAIALILLVGLVSGGITRRAAAQDGPDVDEGGYVLVVSSARCEAAPPNPPTFDGADCAPATGVTINVIAEGGGLLASCVTAGGQAMPQVAGCEVLIPFETQVRVYEDEGTVPAGYAPQVNPIFFTSPPPGPPGGLVAPPIFINLPLGSDDLPNEQAGSITATVYACPPGMTAETLAPDACSVVTDGFSLAIVSYEGIFEPLTLAEADFDGSAYTWTGLNAGPGGTDWGIKEDTLPAGYTDYLATGDAVSPPPAAGAAWRITLSLASPAASVAIYNFAPAGDSSQPAPPAQDETPTAPVDIHPAALFAGSCEELGDQIAIIADVAAPQGDPLGQESAVIAETGSGTIAISLDDLLAQPYAVAVLASAEPDADPISCGDLGAVADDDGTAAIGLREIDGSGFTGIVYLATLAADPTQTAISLFLAEDLADEA